MDMDKYRMNSSYSNMENNKTPNEFIKETVLQEAIRGFDVYQQYSPNTYSVYVNNSTIPILGTITDVSDLEMITDTKWLLTSLDNEMFLGDIVMWNNRKWLVIYDKEKTTQNCFKVKMQPCNYQIKFPYNLNSQASIYTTDTIVTTYLSDMKDFKQPFPIEGGTTFMMMQYNDVTKNINRQNRIWLYNGAYEVTGVDYTLVDNYIGHGALKFSLRPTTENDLDHKDLGICDYYKYFVKPNTTTNTTSSVLNVSVDSNIVKPMSTLMINAQITSGQIIRFQFEGDGKDCVLEKITSNSCVLRAGREVGIVYVKCYLDSDPTKYSTIRIIVQN